MEWKTCFATWRMGSVVGAPEEKAGIGYAGLVHVRREANMDTMTPNVGGNGRPS